MRHTLIVSSNDTDAEKISREFFLFFLTLNYNTVIVKPSTITALYSRGIYDENCRVARQP